MPQPTHPLQQLRGKAGLSTRKLAALAGITHSQISHIENGRSKMSAPLAARLARALAKRLGRSPEAVAGELVMATDASPVHETAAEHCSDAA